MPWTNDVRAVGKRRANNARLKRVKFVRMLDLVKILKSRPLRRGDINRIAAELGVSRQTLWNYRKELETEIEVCGSCGRPFDYLNFDRKNKSKLI